MMREDLSQLSIDRIMEKFNKINKVPEKKRSENDKQEILQIKNEINKRFNNLEKEITDTSTIINAGKILGAKLRIAEVKTTQIRKFLDAVRKIQVNFDKDNVIMLKPKLAYTVGRHKNLKPLMEILDPAIDAGAKDQESFKRLVQLIETIVAYHRFYGGGD